ncbi:unnamed protein product [Didymodactylos carnosus]|uniref:5'-AMP-activated protein kinase subunit beta-1 n=1 Tax=Didymodactylos carnosus TaxID=1234261 RepID=A0A814QNL7_9BILA|nr:unnamed protein product [Didymodactylos carnosus]CAF3885553.1 unnamed protein product [Didymodactylos carnosus]
MGNQQQPSGRKRLDTFTRYIQDGDDGRFVTVEGNDNQASLDDRNPIAKSKLSTLPTPPTSPSPPYASSPLDIIHDNVFEYPPESPASIDSNFKCLSRYRSESDKNVEMNHSHKMLPASYMDKHAKLIGTFNNWKDGVHMVKDDNDFVIIVELPAGHHRYKFIVDGRAEYNAIEPSIESGEKGRTNVLVVKNSDFDLMKALHSETEDNLTYGQILPNPNEFSLTDRPPSLPSHHLNITLNQEPLTGGEYSALLKEPNHVMLKHLYALSIKDGVMVMSTITRYRQKYVTTCFYKPT